MEKLITQLWAWVPRTGMPNICPASTLLGAGLMAAVLIRTAFTDVFRMTLAFGVPFLALLVASFFLVKRPASNARQPGDHSAGPRVTPL